MFSIVDKDKRYNEIKLTEENEDIKCKIKYIHLKKKIQINF